MPFPPTGVDIGGFVLYYQPVSILDNYASPTTGLIDEARLANDIMIGKDSPLLWFGGITPPATYATRVHNANLARKYAWAYKVLRFQEAIGW